MAPRIAIVCVDGATMRFARSALRPAGPAVRPRTVLQSMPSVYPSSTAAAHASMLTGVPPAVHGIVGNRYWEAESVAEIRLRQDPLAALHPYCHRSLRASSLLDDCRHAGYRVSAVMFPHTFDLMGAEPCADALFCLYAPSQEIVIDVRSDRPDSDGRAAPARFSIQALGFALEFELRIDRREGHYRGTVRGEGGSWALSPEEPADVFIAGDDRRLSFRLLMQPQGSGRVVVTRTTAVCVLAFGAARHWRPQSRPTPHSTVPSYTAAGREDFYEAPSPAWVTQSALGLLQHADPDVLLVRYNQVDHAQEQLLWHVLNGLPSLRDEARAELLATYRTITDQVAMLLDALGPEVPVVLFSDHGIDEVGKQVLPNVALQRLGMDEDFVFQGDSNLAYLYGGRPLNSTEETRLLSYLQTTTSVRPISRQRLIAMHAYAGDRSGQFAVQSSRHVTFDYGSGELTRPAMIGSHGFDPALREMDGIFQTFGPSLPVNAPSSILDVRDIVLAIMSQAHSGGQDPWDNPSKRHNVQGNATNSSPGLSRPT